MALVLISSGCSEEPTQTRNPVQVTDLVLTDTLDKGGFDVCEVDLTLLDCEEFAGTIIPGQPAFLKGEMQTWPPGSWFSVNIPADALPPNGGYPVEFGMRIPKRLEYDRNQSLPLIVKFWPEDLTFQVPVQVMTTYMPWRDYPDASDLEMRVLEDNGECTTRTDFEISMEFKRMRIRYDADHFSDYAHTEDIPTFILR